MARSAESKDLLFARSRDPAKGEMTAFSVHQDPQW